MGAPAAELELPAWPAPLAGLRIALLSDLHVGSPHWDLAALSRLVERTKYWCTSVFPVRFLVPSEIALLTLRSAPGR